MRKKNIRIGYSTFALLLGLIAFAFIAGLLIGNLTRPPTPIENQAINSLSTPEETIAPVTTSPPASQVPEVYVTLNVNEFSTYTVYWKKDLWEQEIQGNILIEDFEKDAPGYGTLSYPYLTGNFFLLRGSKSGQILPGDTGILNTGNYLHFRDWETGMSFTFPYDVSVSAFGFDYRPSEEWQLNFNDFVIPFPGTRIGFIGIIVNEGFPKEFNLSSTAHAQGGITIDNIVYVPDNQP